MNNKTIYFAGLNGLRAIDIKKIYLKRILRIWPLYYLYLIIVVITNSSGTKNF
jgi:peptidoglycan/LPS O-acetylase OafA/YrhL